LAALLRDDIGETQMGVGWSLDLEALWDGAAVVAASVGRNRSLGDQVEQSMNLVRGAYGAASAFDFISRILPAAAATVLVSNPFTVGAAAFFGVKHVRDQRRRRIDAQRQQARAAFRSSVEQVQGELTKAIGDAVRSVQRDLRETFTARIQELQRTSAATAARCDELVRRSSAAREAERTRLAPLLAEFDELAARASTLATSLAAGGA
jgi:hypothetical protein